MRLAANIAWQHHERYDGKGYQNELSGEKILNQSGRQFDPQITKLFDEHFDEFLIVMEDYPDA